MFERHFGLRENPFHSGHQLRFLYPSREHQEARAHLRYGIENREPFVLITGEVGTGKTTALYDALAEWGTRVAVALITNSALTRQELIEEIGLRFGLTVPPGASKPQALALLERHLTSVRARGEFAVLLLDEAQNLAPELLEEIRLLSNLEADGERLVQIFLVGQPELEALLARPQLRQLRQRIGVHYRLNPLSPEETAAYIHHRVAVAGGNAWSTFPPETCREVYRVSHGIPREINTVASQALITAFSEGATTVQPEHVHTAARESEFRSVMGGPVSEPGQVPPAREAPTASVSVPAPAAGDSEPVARPMAATPPPQPVRAPEPEVPHVAEVLAAERPAAPQPAVPFVAALPVAAPPGAAAEATDDETPGREAEAGPEPGAEPAPQAGPEPERAWTPPELEIVPPPPPPAVAPVPPPAPVAPEREKAVEEATQALDAWTAAAQELLEARRRGALPESPPRVEVIASAETTRATQVVEPPAPVPFPTSAELSARAERNASASLPGLPGRLRDKIAADIEAEQRREASRRRAVPLVLAAVTAAALATVLVVLQWFQVINLVVLQPITGRHAARSAAQVAATAREPIAVVRPVQSAAVAASVLRRDSLAAANDSARVAPGGPAAAAATAAPSAPKPAMSAPGDSTLYGVAVASYLDRDRAEQERARLAAASGLPATVLPFSDAGTTKFRVVLGRYPSNAAAERGADGMMEKLGVSEARPLVLPRRKPR